MLTVPNSHSGSVRDSTLFLHCYVYVCAPRLLLSLLLSELSEPLPIGALRHSLLMEVGVRRRCSFDNDVEVDAARYCARFRAVLLLLQRWLRLYASDFDHDMRACTLSCLERVGRDGSQRVLRCVTSSIDRCRSAVNCSRNTS